MRAAVFNLGCKVNQYESDVLAEALRQQGYEVFSELVVADIYILNTCAVTREAERKSRQAITRCRVLNPSAKIFICGCASQKSPHSFAKDNVIFVSGATKKAEIIKHLEDVTYSQEIAEFDREYEKEFLTKADRTRAYVKIQDGCDSFCSYCIIPYLRGRSRSRRIEDIVKEVEVLSAETKEIVLTGINIMSFGKDTGTDLAKLISALRHINARIRLGSFYAEGINEELLDSLFSLKSFCPHFHLSLQSGDKQVLHDMNRKYTPEIYADKINLIRTYDANSCVTTDIITGFPTETEENHKNTVDFVKEIRFSDIHVFPFSSREGTRAAKLPQLSPEIVKSRRNELLGIKEKLQSDYLLQNIGVRQNVLIEEKIGDLYCGYSQYYIRIYTGKNDASPVVCVPAKKYKDGLSEE